MVNAKRRPANAFDDLMSLMLLQFPLNIASSCGLHRSQSQDMGGGSGFDPEFAVKIPPLRGKIKWEEKKGDRFFFWVRSKK